jgi:hypothetical protein
VHALDGFRNSTAQYSTAAAAVSFDAMVASPPQCLLPTGGCLHDTLLLSLMSPAVVQCVLEAVRLLLGVKDSVQVNGRVVRDPWRASQKMLLDPDFMDRIM